MVPGRDGVVGAKEGVLFNVQPMSKWDTIFEKWRGGVEVVVWWGFEDEAGKCR